MNFGGALSSARFPDYSEAELGPRLRQAALPLRSAEYLRLSLTLDQGAQHEDPGQWGWTYLLATLLGRGCGPWSRREFAIECDRKGASLEIYAGRESFTIEWTLLPSDLEWGLRMFVAMLHDPRLEEREVELASAEQEQLRAARTDEPRSLLYDSLRRQLFGLEHPYGRSLVGGDRPFQRPEPEELRGYWQDLQAHSHRWSLVAVGGLDAKRLSAGVRSAGLGLVAAAFGPSLAAVKPTRVQAPRRPASREVHSFPIDQAWLAIGYPTVARQDPEHLPTLLANELYGGAFLSRLTRAVRGRSGLAYSADSRVWAGRAGGFLGIFLQTEGSRLPEAIGVVQGVTRQLLEEGPTPQEFQDFRRFLLLSLPYDYDSGENLSSRLLEHLMFEEDWRPEVRYRKLEEAFTEEAVQRTLGAALQADCQQVTVVGGGLTPERLERALDRRVTPFDPGWSALPSLPQGPTEAGDFHRLESWKGNGFEAALGVYANGYHLLHLHRPEIPAVSLQLWSATGTLDEVIPGAGMSHLLEHLMFRGTERFPDGQFDQLLANYGGLNNAFTTEDFTAYVDYLVPSGLGQALQLEADRFQALDLEGELFDTEREVVLEERFLRVDDSPMGKLYEEVQGAVFEGHPYRFPVIGYRAELEALTVEQLRQHYQLASSRERLLVVVAGDCSFERAVAEVGATFGALPSARSTRPLQTAHGWDKDVPLGRYRRTFLEERSGYSYLVAAFRAPRVGHPEAAAVELLSRALAGGDSSRMYDRFVRREAVALDVWAHYDGDCRDHTAIYFGLSYVAPESGDARAWAESLEAGLFETFEQAAAELTEDELERGLQGWRADRAIDTDDLEEWAAEIAALVYLLPWQRAFHREPEMAGVSLEQLRAACAHYLRREQASVVHLLAESKQEPKS